MHSAQFPLILKKSQILASCSFLNTGLVITQFLNMSVLETMLQWKSNTFKNITYCLTDFYFKPARSLLQMINKENDYFDTSVKTKYYNFYLNNENKIHAVSTTCALTLICKHCCDCSDILVTCTNLKLSSFLHVNISKICCTYQYFNTTLSLMFIINFCFILLIGIKMC